MTDSIRQQIITAIDTRMKTIQTTAGYKTNAGVHVFDWLDRDLADSELDAIIYRDRTCEQSSDMNDRTTNNLIIDFEIKVKSTSTTAQQARKVLEDICKAIAVDETWGGLAEDTFPVSNTIGVEQTDKIAGTAELVIEIEYTTNKWDF